MILYAWNTHTYIYMCIYTCDVIHACIWCLWRSSSCSRQRVAGHCRPTASTGTIYNCLGADMVMHGTTGWCGWFTKRGIQQEFLRSILKSKSNLETYGGWTQCIDVKQALRLSSCSLGVIRCVCVCFIMFFSILNVTVVFCNVIFAEHLTSSGWSRLQLLFGGLWANWYRVRCPVAFPQVFGLNFPSGWGRLTQCMETGRARISAVCCPVLLKALFGRGWTGQNWCI